MFWIIVEYALDHLHFASELLEIFKPDGKDPRLAGSGLEEKALATCPESSFTCFD